MRTISILGKPALQEDPGCGKPHASFLVTDDSDGGNQASCVFGSSWIGFRYEYA